MAIKFSSVGTFVTDVKKFANTTTNYLEEEESNRLRGILDELDQLHYTETFNPDTKFSMPHIELNITTEFIENSVDPRRSGELFGQIHHIIGNHFVDVNTYIWLGEAFNELGIADMIDLDLKIAIDEANRKRQGREAGLDRFSNDPLDYSDRFHPNASVRKFKEKELRGGRPEAPIDYDY